MTSTAGHRNYDNRNKILHLCISKVLESSTISVTACKVSGGFPKEVVKLIKSLLMLLTTTEERNLTINSRLNSIERVPAKRLRKRTNAVIYRLSNLIQ